MGAMTSGKMKEIRKKREIEREREREREREEMIRERKKKYLFFCPRREKFDKKQ